ncbi:MAG: hypothetical protein QM740_01745 [Acidovorax sp.]
MPSPTALARRWRCAGWLLLALGWAAALLIYATAAETPSAATGYSLAGGQSIAQGSTHWQTQQTERLGGQGTLLLVQLDHWLGSLWHGRRLAATLAVSALVLALACRRVASLVEE